MLILHFLHEALKTDALVLGQFKKNKCMHAVLPFF